MELDTNTRVHLIVEQLVLLFSIFLTWATLGLVATFLVGNYSKLYQYWDEGIGYVLLIGFVILYGLAKRKEWVLHPLLYMSAYTFVPLCFNPVQTALHLVVRIMLSGLSIFLIWFLTKPETRRVFNETSKTLY